MGNPFFLPDVPAQSSFGALKRQGGRIAPFLMLVIGGAWLALHLCVRALSLLFGICADTGGLYIAELE